MCKIPCVAQLRRTQQEQQSKIVKMLLAACPYKVIGFLKGKFVFDLF